MIQVHELVKDINFYPHFDSAALTFDEELGFMKIGPGHSRIAGEGMLVGFVDPEMVQGAMRYIEPRRPITKYDQLPAHLKTIDAQGKGIGTRAYNVREAFGGTRVPVPRIDVYAFAPIGLKSWQDKQGGRLEQYARHAGRMLRSRLLGVEHVAEKVNARYEEAGAGAVLMDAPPNPECRRKAHGVELPPGITAEFILIRDAATRLHKIGETTSPW